MNMEFKKFTPTKETEEERKKRIEIEEKVFARIFDLGSFMNEKPEQTLCVEKEICEITDKFLVDVCQMDDVDEEEYNDIKIFVEELAIFISHLLNRFSDGAKEAMIDSRNMISTSEIY